MAVLCEDLYFTSNQLDEISLPLLSSIPNISHTLLNSSGLATGDSSEDHEAAFPTSSGSLMLGSAFEEL